MSEPINQPAAPVELHPLNGRTWMIRANGNRSHNGPLYGQALFGKLEDLPTRTSVFDVLRAMIDTAERDMKKMEHVQVMRIDIGSPPNL
jgi:hypothetical protein